MALSRTRAAGAGLAAALVTGCLLAAPPAAHAAPVFTDLTVAPYAKSDIVAGACTEIGDPDPVTPATPLPENGVAVRSSVTATVTARADASPIDVMSEKSTLQATSSATTAGGLPASIMTAFSGDTTSVTYNDSACGVLAAAGIEIAFTFTTPVALWATLRVKHNGPGNVLASIHDANSEADHHVGGNTIGGGGSTTVLLPPGTYQGAVKGDAGRETNLVTSGTISGSASITFAPAGSASKAPAGKASKYVALPGTRTCEPHYASQETTQDSTATLTTKKKLVKQVKKVTFTVNGKKATTLKGKMVRRGTSVALRLEDSAAADITATVVLENGKKRTVKASYLACTS